MSSADPACVYTAVWVRLCMPHARRAVRQQKRGWHCVLLRLFVAILLLCDTVVRWLLQVCGVPVQCPVPDQRGLVLHRPRLRGAQRRACGNPAGPWFLRKCLLHDSASSCEQCSTAGVHIQNAHVHFGMAHCDMLQYPCPRATPLACTPAAPASWRPTPAPPGTAQPCRSQRTPERQRESVPQQLSVRMDT